MPIQIQYQKSQVIQGLRYHFIKQSEIKGLLLFVNVYAIITAVLLFYKKIRPELFLVGSLLWMVLMVVTRFFESPLFFHVYFAPKSFFIIPKTHFSFEDEQLIRGYFKKS